MDSQTIRIPEKLHRLIEDRKQAEKRDGPQPCSGAMLCAIIAIMNVLIVGAVALICLLEGR